MSSRHRRSRYGFGARRILLAAPGHRARREGIVRGTGQAFRELGIGGVLRNLARPAAAVVVAVACVALLRGPAPEIFEPTQIVWSEAVPERPVAVAPEPTPVPEPALEPEPVAETVPRPEPDPVPALPAAPQAPPRVRLAARPVAPTQRTLPALASAPSATLPQAPAAPAALRHGVRTPSPGRAAAPPPGLVVARAGGPRPLPAGPAPTLPREGARPGPARARPHALPAVASGGPPAGDRVEAIPLGRLSSCKTDAEEDSLKRAVLAAVPVQVECRSHAGRYGFTQVANLNSFLMWVKASNGRSLGNRCDELRLALSCLGSRGEVEGDR